VLSLLLALLSLAFVFSLALFARALTVPHAAALALSATLARVRSLAFALSLSFFRCAGKKRFNGLSGLFDKE